jgi:putative ABC transport system permease protein
MNEGRVERARRWYRLVLRIYPQRHRDRYAAEMEETFIVLLRRDHARHQRWGRVRCWTGAVWDALARGTLMRVRGIGPRVRHLGGWDMMGSMASDIRFGVRSLVRRPLFAATAVATLALGIGANASVFTVVEGIMFRPLPYEEPDELVYIWDENPTLGWEHTDVSAANAWDWRERVRAFDDLVVFGNVQYNMTSEGPPELVTGVTTSPNLFRVLGRAPVLGRDFAAHEMGEDVDRVAILSHGFWERRFGADPDVLGGTVVLDGRQTTVIGVLPPDFLFLDGRPDLFVPLARHPSQEPRENHNMNAVARLADGATVSLARTEAAQVAGALAEEYPEANEGWKVSVVPAHEELVGDVARQASIVLLVAVSFVLLMACVNVANLLLARGGTRRRELAVRSALGAGRSRVLRQLLLESLVLAGAGGLLGVFMAHWGYRGIVSALPPQMPPVFQFGVGGSTLAYIGSVTLLSALIFGLAPALRSTSGPMGELRDGGRSSGGRRISRFGGTLVVVQTALAVVLLTGGGLLMKNIGGMRHQDLGFEPDGVLTVRVSPPGSDYPEPEDLRAFWDAVEARVGRVAGVRAVGSTQSHPLMGSNWGNTIRTAGPDGAPSPERSVRTTYVTPGTFDALGFRVVRGRPLRATDSGDGPTVVVVNEAFVSRYLGDGADPLTARLVGDEGDPDVPIVGVVHNVLERAVDRPPEPNMYLALDQTGIRSRSLVVKTSGDPRDFVEAVQEAVWSVDPALPVYSVETMAELIERRIGGFAVIGYLMAAFALMSLLLGTVGIYGVTAFAAQQRTTEIGVRMAMGAQGSDVVRMVVRQGALKAALGLILGLALAFAMGGALSSILVGVSPADPATFVSVTIVLATVSLMGLWLPARRVARVDPVRALASE